MPLLTNLKEADSVSLMTDVFGGNAGWVGPGVKVSCWKSLWIIPLQLVSTHWQQSILKYSFFCMFLLFSRFFSISFPTVSLHLHFMLNFCLCPCDLELLSFWNTLSTSGTWGVAFGERHGWELSPGTGESRTGQRCGIQCLGESFRKHEENTWLTVTELLNSFKTSNFSHFWEVDEWFSSQLLAWSEWLASTTFGSRRDFDDDDDDDDDDKFASPLALVHPQPQWTYWFNLVPNAAKSSTEGYFVL